MDKLARRMILALLVLSISAGTRPMLAQSGDSDQGDRSPLSIVIEPTAELADGIGTQGNVRLRLTAFTDTAPLLLSIQVAGEVASARPAEWQLIEPSKSLIDNIPAHDHFALRIDGLKQGDVRFIDLPVGFPAAGYGYLLANVRSPVEGEPLQLSESFVLYTLAASQRVYFSPRSILDLTTQQLRAATAGNGMTEAEEDEIQKLKRGGAAVEREERPPAMEPGAGALVAAPAAPAPAPAAARPQDATPPSAPAPAPAAAPKPIVIKGWVKFTDVLGGPAHTHPVRAATVQVWDQEMGEDELVATTATDRNGNYSVTVNNNDDGDGTHRDLYVIALAKGDTVSVVDFNDGQVWAIDSLPARKNIPDGTQLTINLTASNDLSHPNNVAFEAYEAANVLSRYLVRLGEKLPAPVTIRYPNTGDGSWYQSSEIALAGTDVHDWDNIHHEYGHHIQALYNLSASLGGSHSLGENLCSTHGKKNGLLLAWGEAWPTFFGLLAQKEMNLASLNIPNLGDTLYTDTKPGGDDLEYNLERSDGALHGEGDELSIQEALWDIYDGSNDPGDAGVTLPARVLWDVVKKAKAHTLSDFHQALVEGRSEMEKMAFGAIYAQNRIGSELVAPDDAGEFLVSTAPAFEWSGNLGCDRDGKALFSIRFYDKTGQRLLWDSPWQKTTRFTIPPAQAALIQAEPGALWVVASRDPSDPETGIYYGQSRTFRLKAGELQPVAPAAPASGGGGQNPEP
ncbi:MAG TPA: hypothetical protein VHC97_12900 [Thermoanaerobaculia bacterium]|jgi:hypothetical protein|nr:hypothetical protein [Thermoanaerobaculia bacterium]